MQHRQSFYQRCDGVTRRDVLRMGTLSAIGCNVMDALRQRTVRAETGTESVRQSRAQQCILVWLDGGPSHLETFDLKPSAPIEVRGPFVPLATTVPGIQLSELLPRTAAIMQHLAIVRSMTSPLGEHNFGTHYLMTGYKPTPVVEYPQFGSVLSHVRPRPHALPANVAVPDFRVGGANLTGNGYLPATTRPFSVGSDPAKPNFQVRDLDLFPGLTSVRLNRRREFLQDLDGFRRAIETSPSGTATPPEFEQAYRLITSASAKRAFELSDEPEAVRNRYGRRTIGQCCLLARRLIERGVPFVTVNDRGWDTHDNLYTRLKEGYTGAKVPVGLIPSLDLALSALIGDLHERGLLDETLVVVMGEFGRTPKLNTNGGRDHWPRVFSVALAGGGVAGGQVIGSSDSVGESPQDRPITPTDLARTIYTLLGVDPDWELQTSDGRSVRVNPGGDIIRELIG